MVPVYLDSYRDDFSRISLQCSSRNNLELILKQPETDHSTEKCCSAALPTKGNFKLVNRRTNVNRHAEFRTIHPLVTMKKW